MKNCELCAIRREIQSHLHIHSRSKVFPSSENVEFKEKSPIEKADTNFDMKFKVFNQF